MTSEAYHEPQDRLTPATQDLHRALLSLMEELEAVDWYQQRIDATQDEELKAVLSHNRDEEKEHAAMVLEWLRRRDAKLDEELRKWLFSDRPLGVDEESKAERNGQRRPLTARFTVGPVRERPRER